MTPRTTREKMLYALVPTGGALPFAALAAIVVRTEYSAEVAMLAFFVAVLVTWTLAYLMIRGDYR